MTLVDELLEKKKKILSSASEKDIIFSDFLSGENVVLQEAADMTDDLIVCYSAFTLKNDKVSTVREIQKTKPLREGFHYSNNIIDLIAIAKHDPNGELTTLQNYSEKHSLKESFIIHKLFPQVALQSKYNKLTNVDEVVEMVLIKGIVENSEEKILTAISDVHDLMDIYLVGEVLKVFYRLHPNMRDKYNVQYLLKFYLSLHKFLYLLFTSFFYFILLFVVGFITYIITPYIVNQWDQLEPYIEVIHFVMPTVLLIFLAAFGKKLTLNNKIKFVEKKIVFFLESFCFRLIGVDLRRIIEIEKALISDKSMLANIM